LLTTYQDLFGVKFDFLLYDVTSTYFEGLAKRNPKAKRGYSRDHRPDCVQVCIGLVVTEEGLPVGYEVFSGNRSDVTTLDEMVDLLENKYGKANRIWAFDRDPENKEETFILCRSEGIREKEKAILDNHRKKLEAELIKVQTAIRKGRLSDPEKASVRIGRWCGKYSRSEKLFTIKLIKDNEGKLTDCIISYKREACEWTEKSSGVYLLRTNLTEEKPERLWKIYMQLSQAENAFRTSKNELGLRPIYHQNEQRVDAHIFVCFLALCLWRTLELWSEQSGLGRSPRKLMQEFTKVKSMDIIIPIKDRPSVRLTAVSKPDYTTQILLHQMGIKLPNRTLFKENVVDKIRLSFS
jgi:transposase